MLNSLINLGLTTIGDVSASALKAQARRDHRAHHPLAGYPKLQAALSMAERSGSLRTERSSLSVKRHAN